MKTLGKYWTKFAGPFGFASLVLIALYFGAATRGRAASIVSIASTGTNQVTLTLTNTVTNGVYEIYWTEYLATNAVWELIAVGASNEVTFTNIFATKHGYFRAMQDTNSTPFTLTVTIISPANGSMVQ